MISIHFLYLFDLSQCKGFLLQLKSLNLNVLHIVFCHLLSTRAEQSFFLNAIQTSLSSNSIALHLPVARLYISNNSSISFKHLFLSAEISQAEGKFKATAL